MMRLTVVKFFVNERDIKVAEFFRENSGTDIQSVFIPCSGIDK